MEQSKQIQALIYLKLIILLILCSFLGIASNNLKITKLTPGLTWIDYVIIPPEDVKSLKFIKFKLIDFLLSRLKMKILNLL